jgi:hypothetical protein
MTQVIDHIRRDARQRGWAEGRSSAMARRLRLRRSRNGQTVELVLDFGKDGRLTYGALLDITMIKLAEGAGEQEYESCRDTFVSIDRDKRTIVARWLES